MGIPTQTQKATKDRINYFLYNMHRPSPAWEKMEASILFTQLEIGIFEQFLSSSFHRFGHLATKTFVVQIWGECEPNGIELCASPEVTWTPLPLSSADISIMDIATMKYDRRGSMMINRCHLYLHLISIYDLLTFDFLESTLPTNLTKSRLLVHPLSTGHNLKNHQDVTGIYGIIFYAFMSSHTLRLIL